MPGYPDFQTSAQWRGDALVSVAGLAIATGLGTQILASTPTTNYAYIVVAGQAGIGDSIQIDVGQTDPGASSTSFSQSFFFTPGAAVYLVPVMLPTFTVRGHARAANAHWSGYVAFTNVPRVGWGAEGQAELLFSTTAAIAAGGTAIVSIPNYAGPANLVIDATQTGFTVRVRTYGLDGVTQIGRPLTVSEATVSVNTYPMWLPSGINELRIGNNAGTPTTFTYGLTAVSYLGIAS